MKASQTVFLTLERDRAVPAGDPAAKFKLVHVGQEISQAQAEKYPGAMELIGGTKKKEDVSLSKPAEVETREPKIETRDPERKKPPVTQPSPSGSSGFPHHRK